MPRPPEMVLRKKVHAYLLKKDKHYQRMDIVRMNEVTGHVSIGWFDREGNKRHNEIMYGQL